MTYTTLESLNDTSLRGLLSFPTLDMTFFYAILLWTIGLILAISSYFFEKDRTGKGNFISSLAVSSFIMVVLSVILRYLELISREVLIINVVLTVIFVSAFLLTDR